MDPVGGQDSLKVGRQLAALHDSSNHVQVLCSDDAEQTISATQNTSFTICWTNISIFDDFISMAQQFNEYRVRSVQFDVYDINPSLTNAAVFSTMHDVYTTGTIPSYTFANVVDGVDSQSVPPGAGKITLYWRGHTTNERAYQSTAIINSSPDFGGLRGFVFQGATAGQKYRIITKAVVDFRGRR